MTLHRYLRGSGVLLALLVLVIAPFFQGLFFWTPLLVAIGVIGLAFALWAWGYGRMRGGGHGQAPGWRAWLPLPGGWAGTGLVVLLLCYLLQFFWTAYPRGNLDWVLRAAAALSVYLMFRAEAGPTLRRTFGWLFILSAAAVGLFGFLEYTGYFLRDPQLAKALSLVNLSDRMFTSLQYPNATAAYFLAAIFVALGLALDALNVWRTALVTGITTFLSLAFFFTISRGAVVVLPFGLLLLFLGLDRAKRWPALLFLAAAGLPMLAALKGVGANSAIHNYISAFRWIGAAVAAGVVAGGVLALFLRLKRSLQFGLSGGAAVLALAALLMLRPAGGLMPKQASRLLDINFRTVNVVLRLIYDQDALRMAADQPLGHGGDGWDRTYRQYQAFNYTARETHDHYAQTAVEAGIPGLLALLLAIGAAAWEAWRGRKGNPLGWSLAAAAGLIAIHAAIDFDLSYGLIWLLLWALLGAARAPSPATVPAPEPTTPTTAPARAWVGSVAGLALAAICLPLWLGSLYTGRAQALADAGDEEQAVQVARKAAHYDPLDSAPLLIVGDEAALSRAAKLDRDNAAVHWQLAIFRQLHNDLPGALSAAKEALRAQPLVPLYYDKVADLAGTLMVDALGKGNRQTASALSAELVQLGTDFNRRKAVADPLHHLWPGNAAMVMKPVFHLRYGQALYLSGDLAGAEPHLSEASKVGLLGSEGQVWLYAIYERRNDQSAMAALAQKPWIRFRNVNPVYQAIKEW